MPRQSRIDAPDALHHVIARGIERGKIFRDDKDCGDFLRRIGALALETETKCYAWALIPNHFHLLLKTGRAPIATFMRRLLTGYAGAYNRRHGRSGHVFQNRYKSILCQQDIYLKELVRYIHLNPLRAGVVKDIDELGAYPYSGHSFLMGKHKNDWQSIEAVLAYFGDRSNQARHTYHKYMMEGIDRGRRPDLIGGGLIRSAGGWENVLTLRKDGLYQKSDERILGGGDFVESVLAEADEKLERQCELKSRGINLDHLFSVVSEVMNIHPEEIRGSSKRRTVSKARCLFCYWAFQELGYSMTALARELGVSLPTVSVAARKGEKMVREESLELVKCLNINI